MTSLPLRVAAAGVWLLAASAGWADGVVTNCTDQALRSALSTGGLVTFSADCSITVTGSLSIAAADTIMDASGHKVTISGGGKYRVLDVATNLMLVGLTISGGKHAYGGGALFVSPDVTVTVSNCVFTSNSVAGVTGTDGTAGVNRTGSGGDGGDGTAGGPAFGGAIWNKGRLDLVSCLVSNNTAIGGAGGKGGNGGNGTGSLGQGGVGGNGGSGAPSYGGGIYNEGNLYLRDTRVTANTSKAGAGGAGGSAGTGIFAGRPGRGGSGGRADAGGLYNNLNVTITNSAIWANTSQGGDSAAGGTQSNGIGHPGLKGGNGLGGGFYNAWWGSLVNCTFYTNTAAGGKGGKGGNGSGTLSTAGQGGDGGDAYGGAIHNTGTLTLWNCTLDKCGAFGGTNGVAGSGIFGAADGNSGTARGGDISNTGSGSCALANSLIALPTGGKCGYGTFVDNGYNLTTDNSIQLGGQSFPNVSNPGLGSFGYFGGPTPTVPLLSGSPAIDRIPLDLAPETDQRGVLRINEKADIGAYEFDRAILGISGRISEGTNGVPGVTVTVGTNQVVVTGTNGNYSANVMAGNYSVVPVLTNYSFSPVSTNVTVGQQSVSDVNFAATPLVAIALGTNNTVQLSAGGVPGLKYVVQGSTNLTDWQALGTNVAPVLIVQPILTNNPTQFFRITR